MTPVYRTWPVAFHSDCPAGEPRAGGGVAGPGDMRVTTQPLSEPLWSLWETRRVFIRANPERRSYSQGTPFTDPGICLYLLLGLASKSQDNLRQDLRRRLGCQRYAYLVPCSHVPGLAPPR